MIDINLFQYPKQHPYSMLDGYANAAEKEAVLAYALSICINAGCWQPVQFTYNHPSMVRDGLLIDNGNKLYSLTEKSCGLLYSVYHK